MATPTGRLRTIRPYSKQPRKILPRKDYGQDPWENAAIIRQHMEGDDVTRGYGPFEALLAWGKTFGDWNCLRHGLSSCGADDFPPPCPSYSKKPLTWFKNAAGTLGLSLEAGDLQLGKLFWDIFPTERQVVAWCHQAGPDTEMMKMLVDFYLEHAEGTPIEDTLEEAISSTSSDSINALLEKEKIEAGDQDSESDSEHDSE